jgi:cyclopropane-fatty-acyl-phospholipid synthase
MKHEQPRTRTVDKLRSVIDGNKAAEILTEVLASADVIVGGDRPWDIQMKDDRTFARVLREGSLGMGEAYMDGWWDSPQLDECLTRILRARLDREVSKNWVVLAHALRARLFNPQATRPFEVADKHYDIGNDLYEQMLDKRMAYTCAYWKGAKTLEEAQENKFELVCRKAGLKPGMRVLELGCGWGGFAAYAAEKHGVTVTAYNVSREQVAYIKERYGKLPIEIHHDDYRKASGKFDAVVSIGLMEHVGPKNYRAYMELVDRTLADGGTAFFHTIASNRTRAKIDPWFDKYIFPHACFPTLGGLADAMEDLLVPEDMHNIGEHYDPTLMEWWKRFDAAWPKLEPKYGDKQNRFYRMWKYYLLMSAATFRSRYLQLYQVVMTRNGTPQPPGVRAA